jgi:muramoyltetrapeptide carboxypeptidase
MLTALRLGGHLARASAVVFGSFTRCLPGPDATTVEQVLAERTADLGIPVLAGAPFGHGDVNHAFVLGREATVVGSDVRFA